MKNKIKKIGYTIASASILMPAVALAQWSAGKTNAQNSGTPTGSIYEIIHMIMNWLLAIVGFLGIIGFVIAGIMYLTSAGDETRIEKAKKAMLMAIVGVIVALVGFVIIQAVDRMLNAQNGF
jgi:hypothetical protein